VFQPVLPIPLGDKYTAFARPVFTYIDGPTEVGLVGGTPSDPVGQGENSRGEFGDTILPVGVGVVGGIGWSWGVGATFIFPTSENDLLGSHRYQAGPTALALWANEEWMVGAHLQHWWGFADDGSSDSNPVIKAAHDRDLNHTDIQYSVISPDEIGRESTIMLQANFIIKNPFGDL